MAATEVDATRIEMPSAASSEAPTLRSTLPPTDAFSKTVIERSDVGASRRSSVLAGLARGAGGPLPGRYQEAVALVAR